MPKFLNLAGLAVAVALIPASAGAAAALSGHQLYDECNAQRDNVLAGWCAAYVAGVADAMAAGASINGLSVCFPLGVLFKKNADIVTQFLTSHPEARHHAAAELVAQALAAAFPCSR